MKHGETEFLFIVLEAFKRNTPGKTWEREKYWITRLSARCYNASGTPVQLGPVVDTLPV